MAFALVVFHAVDTENGPDTLNWSSDVIRPASFTFTLFYRKCFFYLLFEIAQGKPAVVWHQQITCFTQCIEIKT